MTILRVLGRGLHRLGRPFEAVDVGAAQIDALFESRSCRRRVGNLTRWRRRVLGDGLGNLSRLGNRSRLVHRTAVLDDRRMIGRPAGEGVERRAHLCGDGVGTPVPGIAVDRPGVVGRTWCRAGSRLHLGASSLDDGGGLGDGHAIHGDGNRRHSSVVGEEVAACRTTIGEEEGQVLAQGELARVELGAAEVALVEQHPAIGLALQKDVGLHVGEQVVGLLGQHQPRWQSCPSTTKSSGSSGGTISGMAWSVLLAELLVGGRDKHRVDTRLVR